MFSQRWTSRSLLRPVLVERSPLHLTIRYAKPCSPFGNNSEHLKFIGRCLQKNEVLHREVRQTATDLDADLWIDMHTVCPENDILKSCKINRNPALN